MEFNSPQPEHAQLHIHPKGAARLLGKLHAEGRGPQHEDNEENGGGEGRLIPSPPLSPRVGPGECGAAVGRDVGALVMTPSWAPGMTSKRYRYATHGFLSQYRLMGYGGGARPKKTGLARRPRYNKTYASGSDLDKVYRTRRVTKNTGTPVVEGSLSPMAGFARPSPRVNRKKKAHPHVSGHTQTAPLASAKEVHSAPTYVPNMSWEKLPDYSPPLSTLPSNNNTKCLKVEWKGSSMDLSNDPLRHKLHPAELVLAQTLRLPCDLYLDSKRRLFCEKVHRLKQGMPFRRTDAQKACRIDVNKASRLFAAYEKIGWLDDDNFAKYL
ncbi:AaceriADR366Wp [[Ashbya] aceris (nom. inval.)]|nr:AaceriADR366Wp [[Ashbya] aceris (nom. inval.)]